MKRYLWIGSFSTDFINSELHKLGYNNASQHVAQKNLLEAIEKVGNVRFDSLGAILLPDTNKIKYVEKMLFSHADGCEDILVGYRNIKYVNRLLCSRNLVKELKFKLKQYQKSDDLVVYMYEMRSLCYKAAAVIKKNFPSSKIILIVPDLPIYMSGQYSCVKKVLKKIDGIGMKIRKKYIDKYILFAKPMAEYLKIPDDSYIVMEGSINCKDIENSLKIQESVALNPKNINIEAKKVVMYSGVIDKSYGIIGLIKAFEYLDDTYELWITGEGTSSAEVKEMIDGRENIKYFGFLPSRDEVIRRQRMSMALVNMRNPQENSSKYCFPSKLFEYMISGVPVISSMIDGIPNEYYSYLIPLKSNSAEEIAEKIKLIGNMTDSERKAFVKKAYDFVVENKNNLMQAHKIISFVGVET